MAVKIIEEDPDIYEYPLPALCQKSKGSVTIGDLHGNAVKLIYLLLKNKVIQFKEGVDPANAYNEFIKIYEGIEQKRKEEKFNDFDVNVDRQLIAFNTLMEQIKVENRGTLVRFIGEDLANGDANDYFTLRIIKFLKDQRVRVSTTLSNHGSELISAYEETEGGRRASKIKNQSLLGLTALSNENKISQQEMHDLVSCYKSTLKIIDYTMTDMGIRLFTHAPVRFGIIKEIANFLQVAYDDSHELGLAQTIDKINSKFQQAVRANRVHELCKAPIIKNQGYFFDDRLPGVHNMTAKQVQNHPLAYCLWNRWDLGKDNKLTRPLVKNNYTIEYVHAYDSFVSKAKNVINLSAIDGNVDAVQAKLVGLCNKLKVNRAQGKLTVGLTMLIAQEKNKLERLDQGFKVLDSNEKSLRYRKHEPALIDAQFQQEEIKTLRTGLIMGLSGTMGLLLGATIGAGLVMFAITPFGVGLLGLAALIGATASAGASIMGAIGWLIAKDTEITDTLVSVEATANTLEQLGGPVQALEPSKPQYQPQQGMRTRSLFRDIRAEEEQKDQELSSQYLGI